MPKHAQTWSGLALLATLSGLLLAPASSLPPEGPPTTKEVKVEAALTLLPGSLKERANSYLEPSPFSLPATPILTQVEKITAESKAQQEAERKALAEEKAAQAKAAKEKAAAEKLAAEKAAAEKAAAEKAAAEKAAAEKAAAEKAEADAKARQQQEAASRTKPRNTQSQTSAPKVTVPSGSGLSCGPRSGDSGLQEWPAVVRTRIAQQFGVKDIGGYRATSSGEHGKGLALDVMTYNDSAKGYQILEWVKAHHRELNVYYVIWEQKIYGDWTGWNGKPMEDRGDRTANHFDHVHISFNSGSGTCPAS